MPAQAWQVILLIYLVSLHLPQAGQRPMPRKDNLTLYQRPAGTKTLLRTSSNAQDLVERRNKFRLCSNWAFGTPSSS